MGIGNAGHEEEKWNANKLDESVNIFTKTETIV